MINWIWMGLLTIGIVVGAFDGEAGLARITKGAMDSAKTAVDISLGLISVMALFLGLMAIAEKAGMIQTLAKIMAPIMKRLFPEVPEDHPAMGAMMMNMAANVLGVGNAATPLGLKAMEELQKLNPYKKTASNAMCMFLSINTSSVQLVAATVIGLRIGAGSTNPTSIIGPTLVATLIGTIFAIFITKVFEKLPMFRIDPVRAAAADAEYDECGEEKEKE